MVTGEVALLWCEDNVRAGWAALLSRLLTVRAGFSQGRPQCHVLPCLYLLPPLPGQFSSQMENIEIKAFLILFFPFPSHSN